MALSRLFWFRWQVLARRHPSAFLLAVQLLSLIVYPLFDPLGGGRVVFGAFGVLALALVVWVVNRSPANVWMGLGAGRAGLRAVRAVGGPA